MGPTLKASTSKNMASLNLRYTTSRLYALGLVSVDVQGIEGKGKKIEHPLHSSRAAQLWERRV